MITSPVARLCHSVLPSSSRLLFLGHSQLKSYRPSPSRALRIISVNCRSCSSKAKSTDNDPTAVSDDLRERARQRIALFEAQQSMSPNSPLGILERSPGTDPNAVSDVTTSAEVSPNVIDAEAVYAPFPNNVNPSTGEVKGPTGPEPTRFGDWERKGRCSDF